MTVRVDVYNVANSSKLGELSDVPPGLGWFDDLRVPGGATFTLDLADTAEQALLLPTSGQRRRVRINVDGTDLFGGIVQNRPSELVADGTGPSVTVQVESLLGLWGFQTAGAVLEPYKGLDGMQQDPRWFGPMAPDFVEGSEWVEPTSGGKVARQGFPDQRAERFVFSDRAVYRRWLTGDPSRAGNARMMFSAASSTEATVWLDGEELATKAYGSTGIVSLDLPYDGEDHLVFIDCRGGGSLVWSWMTVRDVEYAPDPDEPGETDTREQLTGMFRTFTIAGNLSPVAPTLPAWTGVEDYTTYPGVTIGTVAGTFIDEAQDRNEMPGVSYDFDPDDDSGGIPWARRFARGFPVGRGGPLLAALLDIGCEPEMTPAGVMRLWQRRGTDRTGSVTVTAPFGADATGRGPQATRLLYETEGGFGRAISAAAESALGERMADTAQFGHDLDPDQLTAALADQLAKDGRVWSELDIELPDNVRPYGVLMESGDVPAYVGDTVLCQSTLGGSPVPVRITSFAAKVRTNGWIDWSATAEPDLT